ncbi:hypothetical protein Cgig2_030469 [Carnegiea gigantea]|uniref:Uncharacterized protein n=1 Tax=Carnegiea gigantea TaxID=171969 RepID=A0A9Q1QLL2_9CARY|nr:hypothetical protein Cgig2_030469 [Carnegiea gigantea]
MESPHEAILKSKELKEEASVYVCSKDDNDANSMEELGIAINLNIAALIQESPSFITNRFEGVKELCSPFREKDPLKEVEVSCNSPSGSSSKGVGKMGFDPLELTTSDAKFKPRHPSESMDNSIKSKQGILLEEGTIYQLSGDNVKRKPLRYLWLSQATYGKIKEGNKIEFFDKHCMAYITVRIHHTKSSRRKGCSMNEDAKGDVDQITNVIQCTAKPYDGYQKGSFKKPRKCHHRKKKHRVKNIRISNY